MVFLNLLTVAVTFIVGVAGNDIDCLENSTYNNIPIDVITPESYIINFNAIYHPVIHGNSDILLNIRRTVKRISFHAYGLEVDADSIAFNTKSTEGKINKIKNKFHCCQTTQIVALIFKDDVHPGKYDLHIEFKFSVGNDKNAMNSDEIYW